LGPYTAMTSSGIPVLLCVMQCYLLIDRVLFRPGQTLVAPTTLPTGAFSGGVYSLEFQNGDLRLYSNFGSGPKLYWSLQRKLFHGDLSSVAYAGKYSHHESQLVISTLYYCLHPTLVRNPRLVTV
jgi:hypothetical protein